MKSALIAIERVLNNHTLHPLGRCNEIHRIVSVALQSDELEQLRAENVKLSSDLITQRDLTEAIEKSRRHFIDENFRMAKALKYYADDNRWDMWVEDSDDGVGRPAIDSDYGERARKALAQSPKSQALVEVERAKDALLASSKVMRLYCLGSDASTENMLREYDRDAQTLTEAKRKAGLE